MVTASGETGSTLPAGGLARDKNACGKAGVATLSNTGSRKLIVRISKPRHDGFTETGRKQIVKIDMKLRDDA